MPFIKNHKKSFIIGSIIVVLVVVIVGLLKKPDTALAYAVQKEALVSTIQVNGTYIIASQTEVMSPAKGIITELHIDNNSVVKKSDKLFRVESTATIEEKALAYENYMLAKTNLDAANATKLSLQATMFTKWDTFKELAESNDYEDEDGKPKYENRALPEFHIPEKEWLSAEAAFKNQETVVTQAQASLNRAWLAYQATQDITVTAPAAGIVVNLQPKLGDQVMAQYTSPVLIIADFSNPAVITSINEANIDRIKINQKAEIVFDALPGKKFTGYIERIDSVGTEKQGAITYNVRVAIDNISQDIKPNMTAQITIETLRKNNVLTVPNNAIIENEEGTFVQRSGNENDLIKVKLGEKGLTKTEVIDGLSVGDLIALPE